MTQLSVNINKVATLRNARGGNMPDVVRVALDCERFGAQGITVHPRPDERHIRRDDVRQLSRVLTTEFNIEGYPSPELIELMLEVRPCQATLVPDAPDVLTSSAGWQIEPNRDLLERTVKVLHDAGIRVSIFVDPDVETVRAAAAVGADRVELYTGPYAEQFAPWSCSAAVAPYTMAAYAAHDAGLQVNAGHDLNIRNLHFFATHVPYLAEVSIGHALICDALYNGLQRTIEDYRKQLNIDDCMMR